MKAKFFKDILTDSTGKYFDMAAVFVFLMGIALVLLAAYDLTSAYDCYHEAIKNKVSPLPAIPVFNFQGFGMGAGSVLLALGGHKWLDSKSKGGDSNGQD